MIISADTLDQFEESLSARGLSGGTVLKYGRNIREFAEWVSGQPERACGDQLVRWVSEVRESGAAASTVRLKLAAARAFGKFADEHVGQYKVPPLPPATPHPLPGGIADVRRMLAVADGIERHVVALGGLAGMRVEEIVNITRDQAAFLGGKQYLKIFGKGGKVRMVPVSSELAVILAEMPSTGRLVPLSNSGARAMVTRVARRAGVVGHDGGEVSSHDLRATFATTVYRNTKDIRLVQELLGHSSITTTQIYVGVDADDKLKGVEF